jgi:hypothetical protein
MANIDTTIEIEEAYIKDKLTYKKKRSRKTTYFYDIVATSYPGGKCIVALVYPFNYNATPWTGNKPEFNISWGDGTSTNIKNEYVDMFDLHYDKIASNQKSSLITNIKLHPVPEKSKKPGKKLLYHVYDINAEGKFSVTNKYTVKLSIESDEIVVPIILNPERIRTLAENYIADGNLTVALPYDENTFADQNMYRRVKRFEDILNNCVETPTCGMGGELPMNCIGLPTEEYRKEFSRVFERGIYHPLDQKIAHIKNGDDGIDQDIVSTINTNVRTEVTDYKSPGSMSMYALAGNNRLINKELLGSIGTPNQHPIPIQAYLCAGISPVRSQHWVSVNRKSHGLDVNTVLISALINKGIHINSSLLRISVVTANERGDKVHTVINPFAVIDKVYPDQNGEYKLFKNVQGTETWGFFCNFYSGWRHVDSTGTIQTSPWLHDVEATPNLLKSLPSNIKSMKCVYRVPQYYVDDKLYGIRNEHRLLDSIPKTVEEIENLVVFSNLEFYKKGFRVYREKSEYNDLEAYEGGFRMLPFDNDDGVSPKYKNSKLRVIKNMVFCCDLYPEPLRLGDNAWTTNFDGVSLLYGFNSLEKVDGVFTYCRFKDVGYMRIRDICQRPEKSKYENPAEIEFKQIDLSRVMHWCDVINELAEDSDSNEHALNPFNGHMEKKQRSSWNNTPSYKMRDFFNKMNNETSFNPDKAPAFLFGKQENDADLKHMCLGFLFLERKPYPNDRLGGIVDQTPIFKSVTDFAHGYMMSYSYFNCEGNLVPVKTIKVDGYIQQFYNHAFMSNIRYEYDLDYTHDRREVYLRNYTTGFINPQWISPVGWMLIGKSIFDNRKLDEDLKNAVLSRFKSAIVDMSNMEGLFANVGALACDLTPMNEIYDGDLFMDQIGKIMINGVKRNVHAYSNRFGLYSYNEDDILIKSDKDVNIKRIFQNETYYGSLATDNFFQPKSKYRKWFNDATIYDDNELNKIQGFEHTLAYNMTTFKRYGDLTGSDYKDRIISMGCPRVSPYDIPVWSNPASGADEFLYMGTNSALGSNNRFKSSTTWAHDDNLLNWIFPPLITGYKYRYPTLHEYINAQFTGDSRYAKRQTMNTQYPRGQQGANFLLTKGKFIVNTNNSSTNADYAFDGMILHFGLNKSLVHADVKFNSIKGITTKNTIGVIKHNCDWNFKDENVIGYIPTISRPFNTVVVGEPFTNLKHVIPKRIVPNLEEFNEMVAIRLNEFNSYERYPGRINAMIVPKTASTPARYRKTDNIQYKFKEKTSVAFDEFNYMPTNVIDYTSAIPCNYLDNYDMILGISHVRKLFPDDVDVRIKNFKMPYAENMSKFKILYDKSSSFREFPITKNNFILQSVPLRYALNGATVDNIEEVKRNWNYKGTPIIFKSSKSIDGPLDNTVTCVLRCPYNVDLTSFNFEFKAFMISETDWGRRKIDEKNTMLMPTDDTNPHYREMCKVFDSMSNTLTESIKVENFQPPMRYVVQLKNIGKAYESQTDNTVNKNLDNDYQDFTANAELSSSTALNSGLRYDFMFPTSWCRKTSASEWSATEDENMGGTSRWVNQLPKEIHKSIVVRKYSDRIEFDITRKELEFSLMVVSDIPLWLEGSDYITGEFPPYSDYSEKYPVFKNGFNENWFKTQCFDKQAKGFEIDDVFLEVDDHMKHTMALMQIDNNDLNIPHRVNPYILEPTTYKGQTKFGEIITAYGRKFPIVNFRWTLGFAFSNLPKTVTEVDGFNFADTVYVPDKCVPEQINKFHFHKEFLEPNQTYKEGIMDAVLWLNKPFMNNNIEMLNSVDYFSNIMLFTRRKDSLSNGARTQMEEYYEWSTDNKITLGPTNFLEGFSKWKPGITIDGNSSATGRHAHLKANSPEPTYYEMRRNYTKWVVADRTVKPDDIITVKWVVRFQNIMIVPIAHSIPPNNHRHDVIMNPYIAAGNNRVDMSEDVITYTGKAKDLPNFSVFDYSNIPNATSLYRQGGLPTIKSIRIYGDVYVCPAINWERGLWGVLRGTLPTGTDTRCVPIPQRCYEGIFYRDVKLHGIITGEYDGSLPEKLFWGTRNENLRIQGLYCSTRYANPHSWHTRKRNIRNAYQVNTSLGLRNQWNMLAYVKESGKIVTDNLPATLNNIFRPDNQHNIYNRLTGHNMYIPNNTNDINPAITSDNDTDYSSNLESTYNISYNRVTDSMILSDHLKYAPFSLFYIAGFEDRFNYRITWNLAPDVRDSEQEVCYALDFSRGAFSNVHDASPLSIPHKIDELDVSYLGGFGDLFEVYTDDVFGFTEPNLYNLNFANQRFAHMESYYKSFKNIDATTFGGVWQVLPRPSYPCVPVSSFFGKWFFLNGTIRVKDNSDAYVFSDHRVGHIIDFDGYSPHRFDQTCFDQSIYAVQHENVRRANIYKVNMITHRMPNANWLLYDDNLRAEFMLYHNKFINYQKGRAHSLIYYNGHAVTHGGFGSIERYSRSSIYYPSDMISETVGNIVETGYTPILSSLMKLLSLKVYRNQIGRTETYWYTTVPLECMTPQGYTSNWANADKETMKCRSLVFKRLRDFSDKTIIQEPKWYSSNLSPSRLPEYKWRFKYQQDILENEALLTSVVMCEPSKNMMFRMNGKRRIKARYGRLRTIDYAGNFWSDKTITNQMSSNHMIYQRAILGVIQPMIFKNSAYQGRLQNIRNLTHWACNGFNYGLIDDTGMTQYIDVGREIFIENETGYYPNQMFIGCHPHLKEVKIVNASASEVSNEYREYFDEEIKDPDTNVTLEIVEASQHPSYNQTSPNCFIKESLPFQPCLTKIRNFSTSPLYLTVGETALTHILSYGSRVLHGRKFGRNADDWIWIAGEEEKIHASSTNMRTAIFPTYKRERFVPNSTFNQDPVSQFSSYVDVIVDSKWVDRTMYARQDLPKDQQTPYQGIKIQGTFMGVWTNPETNAWGGAVAPRPKTAKAFDYGIMGDALGGHVNYGPAKGKSLEYGINEIINLHAAGPNNRGLIPVTMMWFGKYKDEISLPNDYYLGSNMGLAGEDKYRASGNPNHNPQLKVFLSRIFSDYWFGTQNTVSLHQLCDKSIISSGNASKPPAGIIVTDDYRFSHLYGQPNTIIYGDQTPVVYCKSQRGWLENPNNTLKLDWWEASTDVLPTYSSKPLLWILEGDSDITNFYSSVGSSHSRPDFAKMSYYSDYGNNASAALNAFENSVIRFNKSTYPSTDRLNITNAFNGIRFRWFNYDLSKPGYSSTLAKYRFNVANYVRENFDRTFFNGKINITGKSEITS